MKFQYPVISFMVTSDSPACFEIPQQMQDRFASTRNHRNKLHYEGNDPLNLSRSYTQCNCQCQCECTCQCKCQCECQCQCPCTTKTLFHKINVPKNIMLRQEKIGGLLFDKTGLTSYLCNPSAFAIMDYIGSNDKFSEWNLHGLAIHIKNTFSEVPMEVESILLNFICGCVNHKFLEVEDK